MQSTTIMKKRRTQSRKKKCTEANGGNVQLEKHKKRDNMLTLVDLHCSHCYLGVTINMLLCLGSGTIQEHQARHVAPK